MPSPPAPLPQGEGGERLHRSLPSPAATSRRTPYLSCALPQQAHLQGLRGIQVYIALWEGHDNAVGA